MDWADTNIIQSTDALGRKSQFQWDGSGNMVGSTDPLGFSTQTFYNDHSKPITKSVSGGGLTITQAYQYDNKGNLIKATDPSGAVTQVNYDSLGRIQSVLPPSVGDQASKPYQLGYNDQGDLTQLTNPAGAVTQMGHDAIGRTTSVTNPLGYTSKQAYNGIDDPTVSTNALEQTTQMIYDNQGRLTAVKNSAGVEIEKYTYDSRGRMTHLIDATGKAILYEYDGLNRVIKVTDRNGKTSHYTYDLKDRVVLTKDGLGQETTIQYDAVGQVVQITHPAQSTQYDWDDAGRLVKETTKTQAGTTTLQMQFDGLNRLVQKQVTHQGAGASTVASPLQTTRYLYDLAGRTTAISQTIGANANANNTLVTRYEWDVRGRLVAKHLPRPWLASSSGSAAMTDFFASSNAGISQLYSYDLLDQLTQIQYRQTTSSTSNASAGNLIDQIDYTYDKAGQRISRKQQNGQALPETPMQAQYNQVNRLTQLTLYPNTAQAKTYVLDYDLEGNLIKKQNSTDASCTQDCTEYVWDANNRLAQLKINGQTTAVYSYDAQGRRVEASISTSNNGSPQTNTVQYIYEGNQAVGEVRNGQLSHSLLTGLFIDEHLARTAIATNGQTQSQAQLTDALGSVIALANAQTSSINTRYSYSPYGQTQATGETSSNNQQYTGREAGVEGEAGLYYYRARYYDPVLKRFISEDPIGLSGGLNVYAYVEGDPVSFSDPKGEFGVPGAAAGAAINLIVQLGVNLIKSNGDWESSFKCIDLGDVAVSAVMGFMGPGLWGNVIRGNPGPAGLSSGGNLALWSMTTGPVGAFWKKATPKWRPFADACDCKKIDEEHFLDSLSLFAH